MNQISSIQPSRLPISSEVAKQLHVDPAQWRVLVDQIYPTAKSVEAIGLALSYCRARNLDVFKKPVHIVPMWSSVLGRMVETVWPGIAEIRTTAARTGEYVGLDDVKFGPIVKREFSGKIKNHQKDTWEDIEKAVRFPEWAKVTVYRWVQSQRCPFPATVYWEEAFASIGKSGVPNEMWEKRPRGQLDKCVEAAALRKAFPEELGGVYAAEEMEGRTIEGEVVAAHAESPEPPKPPVPPSVDTEPVSSPADDEAPPNEPPDEVAVEAEPVEESPDDSAASPLDVDAFLTELDVALAHAGTTEAVEQVWSDKDVDAVFTHDPDSHGIAVSLKTDRIKAIS